MTKFKGFNPEDCFLDGSLQLLVLDLETANAKIAPLLARLQELEAMIENAPVVYGFINADRYLLFDSGLGGDYKAKLILIEEIK